MSKGAFVYVMARRNADGFSRPTKVGITGTISARLSQIRTASPFPVDVFCKFHLPRRQDAVWVERAFHCTQAESCLHGEWFDMDPKIAGGVLLLAIGVFLQDVIGLNTEQMNLTYPHINIDGGAWAK